MPPNNNGPNPRKMRMQYHLEGVNVPVLAGIISRELQFWFVRNNERVEIRIYIASGKSNMHGAQRLRCSESTSCLAVFSIFSRYSFPPLFANREELKAPQRIIAGYCCSWSVGSGGLGLVPRVDPLGTWWAAAAQNQPGSPVELLDRLGKGAWLAARDNSSPWCTATPRNTASFRIRPLKQVHGKRKKKRKERISMINTNKIEIWD